MNDVMNCQLDTTNLIEIKPKHKIKIISETLSRLGIGNHKNKILYQTCHIIKVFSRWFLIHYKEGFFIDGKFPEWVKGDLERRNEIANLLERWGLIEILNPDEMYYSYGQDIDCDESIKIYKLKREEKDNYIIERKIDIKRINDILREINGD